MHLGCISLHFRNSKPYRYLSVKLCITFHFWLIWNTIAIAIVVLLCFHCSNAAYRRWWKKKQCWAECVKCTERGKNKKSNRNFQKKYIRRNNEANNHHRKLRSEIFFNFSSSFKGNGVKQNYTNTPTYEQTTKNHQKKWEENKQTIFAKAHAPHCVCGSIGKTEETEKKDYALTTTINDSEITLRDILLHFKSFRICMEALWFSFHRFSLFKLFHISPFFFLFFHSLVRVCAFFSCCCCFCSFNPSIYTVFAFGFNSTILWVFATPFSFFSRYLSLDVNWIQTVWPCIFLCFVHHYTRVAFHVRSAFSGY